MKWWFAFCYLLAATLAGIVGQETYYVLEFLWLTEDGKSLRFGIAGWVLATTIPLLISVVSVRSQKQVKHLWAHHVVTVFAMLATCWVGGEVVVTAGGLGNEMAVRSLLPAAVVTSVLMAAHAVAAIVSATPAGRRRSLI